MGAAAGVALVGGFSALGLEVLWARRLALVFGGTVHAATAVLCAYTLGAAVGAAVCGPWTDRRRRPALVLGLVLLAIGVLGWACHEVLAPVVGGANAALFGTGPTALPLRGLVRFGWSLVALLPASLALGSLWPVAARCAAPASDRLGRRAGLVWAAATAGSLAGAVATGFYLIPRYGVHAALVIAVAPSLAAGALLVLLARKKGSGVFSADTKLAFSAKRNAILFEKKTPDPFLGVVFLTGAGMLAAEVLALRALVFFLGATTYTFTIVVAMFLAGLAIGSAVSARWAERWRNPWRAMSAALLASGLAVLAGLVELGRLDPVGAWQAGGAGWSADLWQKALAAAGVVLVPAMAIGAAVPLFVRAAAKSGDRMPGVRPAAGDHRAMPSPDFGAISQTGRRVGQVSALFNAGAAVGAAVAVLALVPALGVRRASVAVAALFILLGALALGRSRGVTFYLGRGACFVALVLCVLSWGAGDLFWPAIERQFPAGERLFYREGPDAVVTVVEQRLLRTRSLVLDRMVQGDDSELGTLVQWRQGLIPMLLHPAPRRVLVVGLGTGATAFAAQVLAEEAVDVVEISAGVFEAARHFGAEVETAGHTRAWAEDGRAFLANTRQTYDVIIIDIVFPGVAGAGNLFSADFYRLCYERLAPGGLVCHWVPGWQMDPDDLAAAAWAFRTQAPRGAGQALWCAVYSARQPVLGFVGWKSADRIPGFLAEADLASRMGQPRIAPMLALTGLGTPLGLFSHLVWEDVVWPGTSPAAVNSDTHPVIEFSVPRRAAPNAGMENLRAVERALGVPLPAEGPGRRLGGDDWAGQLAERRQAVRLAVLGQLRGAQGDTRAEAAAYAKVRELGWTDPVIDYFHREARLANLLDEAQAARAAGETARALDLAREAVDLSPTSVDAHCLVAACLVDAGDHEDGAETAKAALDLDPSAPLPRFIIAMARYQQGKHAVALGEVNELLAAHPDHLEGRQLRLTILKRFGKRAEADREQRIIDLLKRRGAE